MSLVDTPRRSLAEVRAVLPAVCHRRPVARGLATIILDLMLYGAVLAALVLVRPWWAALPLVVVAGLSVGALFILGHDASHGALFDSARLNRFFGVALLLPSIHVEEAWAFGHNRVHHGFTARQGLDFVWHPVEPTAYASLPRRRRVRHRLEWSWAGSGAYYLREVWWNKMMTFTPTRRASRIRRDRALTLAAAATATGGAFGLGWVLGGGPGAGLWMAAKLVVLPFLVFIQVIGWTVYVHHVGPDIRWWTSDEWSPWRGQMESTTVLRIPRVLNLFFHNIFVHVPHHVDTRVPWYRLPVAAAAIEAAFPGTVIDKPLRVSDYVRATRRCKLYDFTSGTWLTYTQAARQHVAAG